MHDHYLLNRLVRVAVVMLPTVMTVPGVNAAESESDILVFGGTGQLRARIVRLLLEDGHDVAVFVRPTSDRSRLDEPACAGKIYHAADPSLVGKERPAE